ncbi:hypothetical protein [Lentzea sp. NBRC 102530]|uniref:hypothetical protein n=1 Tax=Lentzea sp. NBRC 102530 TaxID=3032201 RepID=UPI0024A10BB3|nr:hypothetical protein [Lentzea sp. NBRC 102530]GLY54836.1 hypothetical protein Lesp01_84910 [Lentzea sp. NBRC 102530]
MSLFARLQAPRGVGRLGRFVTVALVAFLVCLSGSMGAPAAMAAPLDCKDAPSLEKPGAGMVGSLDRPIGLGRPDTIYLDYGYAGTRWNTYDQAPTPPCFDVNAGSDTAIGNFFFDIGKVIVGATNAAYWMSLDSGSVWVNLDDVVVEGTRILYQGFTLPFLALALLLVSLLMFKFVLKGDLASTSTAAGRVTVGLWLASSVFLTPLTYATVTDGILVQGVEELRRNVLGSAGIDYSAGIPTMLHDEIVWKTWLTGEFGSAEGDLAQKYGRPLIDAQAWSTVEIAEQKDGDQKLLDAKRENFKKIAAELQKSGSNYDTFRGKDGSRKGAGFGAFVKAAAYAPFQLISLVGIFLAQLLFRLAVMLGPVLGLLMFMPGVARTVGRAIGGALIQGLILVGASIVHAILLNAVLKMQVGLFAQLLIITGLTIVMWQAVKPWRRLRNMVTAAAGLPLRTRHEDSLEDLLRRQGSKNRGGVLYDKLAWWLRPPVDDRVKASGMQGGPARPETIYDAEIVEPTPPGTGVVISQRRGGRSEGYVNADSWESHAPKSRTARGALATARPEMPGDASDPSAGRPPRGGDPGGSGSGGAGGGVRAEGLTPIALPAGESPESTPSRGDVREPSRPPVAESSTPSSSAVSGELVVPSRMEREEDAAERWRAAEVRDVPQATSRGVGDQEVWQIYRPSTGDVESSGGAGQNTSAHRPEVQGD